MGRHKKVTPLKVETETPETVQTVQEEEKPKERDPFFEIAEDDDGLFAWCLWSGNGRMLAQSAIGYKQVIDCRQAINTMNSLIAKKVSIVISHPNN